MKIYYSRKFAREYKKLPLSVKKKAEEKEVLFCQDPFHPQLKTHHLKGNLKGFLSLAIDQNHRIIFELIDSKTVWFHSVGNHSIYKMWE